MRQTVGQVLDKATMNPRDGNIQMVAAAKC